MKRMIPFLMMICFCSMLNIGVEAQRAKRQKLPQQSTKLPTKQEEGIPIPKPVSRSMTFEEKKSHWANRNFWIGQRVIFLRIIPQGRYDAFYRLGKPMEHELAKDYVGKTGVITDLITMGEGVSSWSATVLTMDDSGEKVVASFDYLGFQAEMEIAKSYIGKSVWAQGGVLLIKDFALGMPDDQIKAHGFVVKNTQSLTVTRAEWGDHSCRVYLCFKTASGQEGCLFRPWLAIDDRFGGTRNYLEDFYFEDQHKKFPNWSKQIWEPIENQEIAIGMTEDQARLACGGSLGREGVVLSSPDGSGMIYSCGWRKFLVNNGKVIKYVQ